MSYPKFRLKSKNAPFSIPTGLVDLLRGKTFAYVRASNAVNATCPTALSSVGTLAITYTCDGTADNTEIQTAFNAYTHVIFSDGTFNIATKVTKSSAVIGYGLGKYVTTFQAVSTLATMFEITNPKTEFTGSVTMGTGTDAAGQSTITFGASIAARSELNVGNYITYRSSDSYNNRRSAYNCHELLQVATKGTTTITVTTPLVCSYTNNAKRIYSLTPMQSAGFYHCGFINGTATGNTMVEIGQSLSPIINNCYLDGKDTARQGFQLSECISPLVVNCVCTRVVDSTAVSGQAGHGIYFSGCIDGIIRNCRFLYCKDGVDLSGETAAEPMTARTIIEGCYSYKCTDGALDTHGKCYDTTIRGCESWICDLFINLRGKKSLVEDCWVYGSYPNGGDPDITGQPDSNFTGFCILIGELVSSGSGTNYVDGISGEDVTIRRVFVHKYRSTNDVANNNPFNSASVQTNADKGTYIYSYEAVTGLTVEDCTFKGLSGNGICLHGNLNSNILIDNNYIEFNTQFSNKDIMLIDPQSGTTAVSNVSFTNNTVVNAFDTSAPYCEKTVGGTITETGNTVS